jgi:hypothetical protein
MKLLHQIITFIFHPLLLPSYNALLFIYTFESLIDDYYKFNLLLTVAIGTLILPLLTGLLLLLFKVIHSPENRSKTERIVPILSTGIYFFVTVKILARIQIGVDLADYLTALLISFAIAVFILRNSNPSIQSTALASLVGFWTFIGYKYQLNSTILIITLLLVFGLVTYSKLKTSKYTPRDIYLGGLIGFIPQAIILILN